MQPYYEEGLDGVIMQDLGAVRMIRRFFPDLEIHASTQMTITGFGAANYLKKVWRDKNCTGPGALTCRIKAAEDRDRSGTGNLYPWQHVLLLFRSMPLFKHARTEKREQRAVRRSVQTALSAAGGRTYDQCKRKNHISSA